MKSKVNIFSNNKINEFIKNLLSKYELTFLELENINYKEQNTNVNIIFINKEKDFYKINFENLNENNLIISNIRDKKLNLNNRIQSLNIPTSVNNIKNKIESFIHNLKVQFHDILSDNEKLKWDCG